MTSPVVGGGAGRCAAGVSVGAGAGAAGESEVEGEGEGKGKGEASVVQAEAEHDHSGARYTVDQAIDGSGFGRFQTMMLFFTGLAWMGDAMVGRCRLTPD